MGGAHKKKAGSPWRTGLDKSMDIRVAVDHERQCRGSVSGNVTYIRAVILELSVFESAPPSRER